MQKKCCEKNEIPGMTRRQFLGRSGVSVLSVTTVTPILYDLFRIGRAEAATTPTLTCPLICVHLSGGYASHFAQIPYDAAGTPLSSHFSNYGIPSNLLSVSGSTTNTLGPLLNNGSAFVSGMMAQLDSN